jgi:hypothetical protein
MFWTKFHLLLFCKFQFSSWQILQGEVNFFPPSYLFENYLILNINHMYDKKIDVDEQKVQNNMLIPFFLMEFF